ncbi:MAG: LacI family DNA-binding transcriptional regulator [Lachnospiraceae bacterium]|nr:LacI family DNA-binding transcriptional regulator [Lachnospiraceae bacterium]
MAKKIKLADIAAALDVSVVTVSKALSDQKGVSEEMRLRIKELAREWGYSRPSDKMEGGKQHFQIGVIIPEQYLEKYEYFYWQLYREVHKSIKQEESTEVLEILEKEEERSLLLPQFVTERKVSGIIVIGKLEPLYEIALQEEKLSVVYLESYSAQTACDAVISNGYYGTYLLTRYLLSTGHIRIDFVGSYQYDTRVADRYLGYCKAMMEQGQQVQDHQIIEDRDSITRKITEDSIVLPEADMPTAFVCSSDLSAAMLINGLRKNGYRVPNDISVVGFDNSMYPGLCDMGLTSFEVETGVLAKRCVELLLKRLNGEPVKTGIRIVEGRIIYRDSVHPGKA